MSHDRWKQKSLLARFNSIFLHVPKIVALGYAAVSALWILLSDRGLGAIAGDYSHYKELQTYKGWLFVAASSLLIFFVLRSAWKGILSAYEASLESERRLQLALASAGGGIWELDLTGNNESIAFVSEELLRRLGLPDGHELTLDELRERSHPDDSDEADRRLERAIASRGDQPYDMRYRVLCEDGLYRWVHSRGKVVASADGRPEKMVGVALDIDDQVRAEERIATLLNFDPVTGLSKQGKFLADIDDGLAAAPPDSWAVVVQVKVLDLDRLVGDDETVEDAALVRAVADRLRQVPGVLASRVASDVFALATFSSSAPSAAQRIIREALERLLEPVHLKEGDVKLRLQAGGATGRRDGETAIGLLRNSGHALELAEKSTAICVRWLNEELSAEFAARSDRVRGLENAVSNGEIDCHFQPLVCFATGQVAGFEALARWHREKEGLVMPDKFIALAEDVGKIAEIGEEVLRRACRTAASWPSPTNFVAVNVSPLQLEDPTFPYVVARVLSETGLSPTRLELEITENALLRDPEGTLQRIRALRDLGIMVAVDDFGTGYSSLSLLSKIPFTRLKIDRSFVSGSDVSQENMIIVDTIIDLAKRLGLSITAEGIETPGQAEMLAAKGVDLGQGYHFARPVAAPHAGKLIEMRRRPIQEHPEIRLRTGNR